MRRALHRNLWITLKRICSCTLYSTVPPHRVVVVIDHHRDRNQIEYLDSTRPDLKPALRPPAQTHTTATCLLVVLSHPISSPFLSSPVPQLLLHISFFMPLPVAINGTISLQGPTRQGDTPQPLTKRAMIIRMSEETLEALAAYPAHPPLQFEFGDTPVRTHPHATLLFMSCSNSSSSSSSFLRVSTSSPPSSQCEASKNPHPTNFTFVLR